MRGKHILMLALCAAALLPARAQTIYRCGNSYSQTPCAGGSAIDASDSRDRAQKNQADAAIRRDLKTADSLEKSRARQEAAQARAARPAAAPGGHDIALPEVTTDQTYHHGKKAKRPEYFTAKTPGDHNKKNQNAGHGKPDKPAGANSRQ